MSQAYVTIMLWLELHVSLCAVLSFITRYQFSLYASHLNLAQQSIHSFTGTLTRCYSLMHRPTNLPNVDMRFYCPQVFPHLDFQCRDGIFESKLKTVQD